MINFDEYGWHGVISDDITFENVSIVAQAAADYINDFTEKDGTAAVGFDTRFLSREYAGIIQRVLTGNGINVFIHKKPVPTSVLSYSVRRLNADLGIMVTGEGRPARYSGMVFKIKDGLPADGLFMNNLFNYLYRRYPRQENGKYLLKYIDITDEYISHITDVLQLKDDCFKDTMIIYDSFFGSTGTLLEQCLKSTGAQCLGIRTKPNPCFQDSAPKPNERNIQPITKLVLHRKAAAGFFYSGDGGRLGFVDSKGNFISEPLTFAAIFTEWYRLFKGYFNINISMDAPYIAKVLVDHIKKIMPYDIKDQNTGKNYNGNIKWDSSGLTFDSVLPDNDAIFQSALLLSALRRHKYSFDRIANEIERITGKRYYAQKLISMDRKQWKVKKEAVLNLEGEAFTGLGCIDIEEGKGIKLNLEEGGFIYFEFNDIDENLQLIADLPDKIHGKFGKPYGELFYDIIKQTES